MCQPECLQFRCVVGSTVRALRRQCQVLDTRLLLSGAETRDWTSNWRRPNSRPDRQLSESTQQTGGANLRGSIYLRSFRGGVPAALFCCSWLAEALNNGLECRRGARALPHETAGRRGGRSAIRVSDAATDSCTSALTFKMPRSRYGRSMRDVAPLKRPAHLPRLKCEFSDACRTPP
jgi:hypothetical protein